MEKPDNTITNSYVLELGFTLIFILKAWYYNIDIPSGKSKNYYLLITRFTIRSSAVTTQHR